MPLRLIIDRDVEVTIVLRNLTLGTASRERLLEYFSTSRVPGRAGGLRSFEDKLIIAFTL